MSVGMIAAVVGLLLANAFFVGAEFAIISARRSSIEPLAEGGSRAARTVLWAMENVSLMLACARLGITVCSVSLGVVAEPALAHAIEPAIYALGLPSGAAHVVAVVIALIVIVGLHVVVGEMVPKNAAVASPDRAALVFGPPLVAIARVVRPIIAFLNWIANGILRMVGIEPRDEVTSAFTADEVHGIIEGPVFDSPDCRRLHGREVTRAVDLVLQRVAWAGDVVGHARRADAVRHDDGRVLPAGHGSLLHVGR